MRVIPFIAVLHQIITATARASSTVFSPLPFSPSVLSSPACSRLPSAVSVVFCLFRLHVGYASSKPRKTAHSANHRGASTRHVTPRPQPRPSLTYPLILTLDPRGHGDKSISRQYLRASMRMAPRAPVCNRTSNAKRMARTATLSRNRILNGALEIRHASPLFRSSIFLGSGYKIKLLNYYYYCYYYFII